MIDLSTLALLKGKKALVTGIANDQSIAWGCAKAFHAFGADLAITYRSEKTKRYVDPLVKEVDPAIYMPLDVQKPGELEAVFDAIKKKWGKLDIVLHSIAFAPKEDLQGRVVDCSKDGFLMAMELSCWSFIRMAKLAEPLMKDGGTLFTMTYYGSQMVVENYNIMGPVKAALRVGNPLHGRRAWTKGHQGPRHFPWSPEDPRGFGDQRLRQAPAEGAIEGADPQPRLDRRRRGRRRLPRDEWRQADHRRDALYRRRLSHHRLTSRVGGRCRHHSGTRPSFDNNIATHRQLGTCAQTIMTMTRMGTLRNMPTIPQIAPQKASPRMIARGLMFRVFPISMGSKTLPTHELYGGKAERPE